MGEKKRTEKPKEREEVNNDDCYDGKEKNHVKPTSDGENACFSPLRRMMDEFALTRHLP